MSPEILIICGALVAHFVADFIFQTDEMAINKSSDNFWLTMHVATYSSILLVFGLLASEAFGVATPSAWLAWAIVNYLLHFATDYCTSRWTTKLHLAGRRGAFFKVIGFDQLIHALTLIVTLSWLVL